ncbi:type I-C CRISPR-associated protein Cas8c/Csd1 [Caniella muris]|uniref:type I-C CRISPR-associated protein Cas8c/Csd1 n=1 Tax=Caniella muris TaxID=2941502 RepID=UPI002040ACF3|nr:type I-C CRISPR-associated protein Cas8c/Csd1 [Caniella muris]
MLLEDLVRLHGELVSRGAAVAPAGMAWRKVRGRVAIDPAGRLLGILPGDYSGDEPAETLAPAPPVRSANIAAALLCDTAAYLLGHSPKGDARAAEKFEASRRLHREALGGVAEAAPLLAFLDSWDPARAPSVTAVAESPVDLDGAFLEFCLVDADGAVRDLLDTEGVKEALERRSCQRGGGAYTDLVTGEPCEPLRVHPKAPALAGPGEKAAPVVGCNIESAQSWGASQGYLSPMARPTAERYSAALDWLLKDGCHSLRLGEATFVWWADGEADASVAPAVADALRGQGAADVDADAGGAPLHVACLSSKYARVQLRWYETVTWDDARDSLGRWEGCFGGRVPSAFSILKALERPGEKAPATRCQDAASLVGALVVGGPWPRTLTQRAAAMASAGDIGPTVAGTLAASALSTRKESGMETDDLLCPADPAYRAGCIFAILEGLQKAAQGRLAAPVRTRYMAGAAKSPARVLPTLVATAQAHLKKLSRTKPGLAAFYESALSEAVAAGPVPLTMDAAASWRFYVGYYRQRDQLYRPAGDGADPEAEEVPAG